MIFRNSHILSGIRWTLLTAVIKRFITLVMFYFVARWLSQDDLGLFRAYSLILVLVSMLASLSLDYHFIIDKKQVPDSLTALWQISLIGGGIAFVLLTAGAGIIGHLYKSQTLTLLFRFTSVFIFIEVFRRTVRAIAQKKQQFQSIAMAETANVIFYSLLAVVCLYFYRSMWLYLVVFYLGNAIELIWLWMLNRTEISEALTSAFLPKNRTALRQNIRENKSFLSIATLVSGLNQLTGNAPILVLGMLVNPVYMGMYFFASQIIGMPVGMFNSAVNQVFFPVFAGQQDGEISNIAKRYVRLVGSLGLPVLMLFGFLAMYLVQMLFGSKWSEAIPLLPVMIILYGSSLYCSAISGIPFAKRKPEWELYWNVVSLTVRVGAMLIGLQDSFRTAIWAFAISSAVMHFAFYLMAMHLVQVRLKQAGRDLLGSVIPAMLLGGVFVLIRHFDAWWAVVCAVLSTLLMIMLTNLWGKGKLWADIVLISGRKHNL